MRDNAVAGGDSDPGVPPFPPEIHLKTPSPANAEQRAALLELRDLLEKSHNASYNYARSWCTDSQLVRFLVARNYHIPRAFVLTLSACEWRATRKPSEIERQPGWEDMIRCECETGKIYCPGYDRWHRPVIIFDNSVQNTHSHDAHILFLAWNLELGTRMMPPDVDKYVILINLQHFSLRNNPTLQTTKETIKMLCDCFPERLGHLICYQPPWIFKGVFEAVKIFIDPKTVSKVHFLVGDDSDGTENDAMMRMIIGDDWRALTGAGQPVLVPGCSPGFDMSSYWPMVMARVTALQAEKHGQGPAGGRDKKGTAAAAAPPLPPTAPTPHVVAVPDGTTSGGARPEYATPAGARGGTRSHASDAAAVSDPHFYAPRLCFLVLLVYMIVFHGPHL